MNNCYIPTKKSKSAKARIMSIQNCEQKETTVNKTPTIREKIDAILKEMGLTYTHFNWEPNADTNMTQEEKDKYVLEFLTKYKNNEIKTKTIHDL